MKNTTTIIDKLISYLFPFHCLCCNKIINFSKEPIICDDCKPLLPLIKGKCCSVCGLPIYDGSFNTLCPRCRKRNFSFVKNYTPFLYKDGIRNAILSLKFSKQKSKARTLGYIMAANIITQNAPSFDYVTHVPSYSFREISRGFNQAQLLAEYVSINLNSPHKVLIKKIRDTKKQSTLKMSERLTNVKNAYKVNDINVEGKTILLIDDVLTTGSTLYECSQVLKKAGAKAVYCSTASIVNLDN